MEIFNDKIKAELKTAKGELEDLKNEVADLTQDLTATKEEAANAKTELAEMQAKFDKKETELSEASAKLETFDADVDAAAITKIAAIGHEPIEVAEESEADPLADYKAMPAGQARFDYRKENPELFKK